MHPNQCHSLRKGNPPSFGIPPVVWNTPRRLEYPLRLEYFLRSEYPSRLEYPLRSGYPLRLECPLRSEYQSAVQYSAVQRYSYESYMKMLPRTYSQRSPCVPRRSYVNCGRRTYARAPDLCAGAGLMHRRPTLRTGA